MLYIRTAMFDKGTYPDMLIPSGQHVKVLTTICFVSDSGKMQFQLFQRDLDINILTRVPGLVKGNIR